MSTRTRILAAAGLMALAVSSARAQITSSLQTITLSATKGQTVTLSAPSPAAQAVTLVDGEVNQYTNPFSTTVGWNVNASTTTTVKVVAYFTTPAQALANGSDYLASSLIEVSTDDGATWHPLSGSAVGSVGTAGGSYVLFTSAVTNGANRQSTTTVTFLVRVNLTTNPQTSAGTYSGTLNIMAICS